MIKEKDIILTISGLRFAYPGQTAPALDGIDLTVKRGEFLVLCGRSGSGKTTLLRQLKPALTPHGERRGEILFSGTPLEELSLHDQTARIGFVQQSPEHQIVTDKVWHELAFGLESLGCDSAVIRRRVAEMAAFFGMESWFHRDVSELSGGQKQLLNLAAVMTMAPEVLLLDEPTSQLDPIAASEFISVLGRINRELGTTVLLTEHRLEEVFPLCSRAAVLEQGRLLCCDTPAAVGAQLRARDHGMFRAMPAAMRIWQAADGETPCPVTVGQGREWLTDFAAAHPLRPVPPEKNYPGGDTVLDADGVWFRYEKDGADVLRGLRLQVRRGEFLALLGGNGVGKTTALKLMAGLLRPCRGSVCRHGKAALLPQEPQTVFMKKTVLSDLEEISRDREKLERIIALCDLGARLQHHPYDLSGGEQQRAALGKVLLTEPEILLLDEPTKGLDAAYRDKLGRMLQTLAAGGVTVIVVSHDVEFCAMFAHRCAMLFDGAVVTEGTPRAFFSGNSFYTTAANRMARALLPEAVTAEDVMAACGAEMPQKTEEDSGEAPRALPNAAEEKMPKLPLWRRITAVCAAAAALGVGIRCAKGTDLSALIAGSGVTALGWAELRWYGVLIAALAVLAAAMGRSARSGSPQAMRPPLRRRTIAAVVIVLLLIPPTLFLGSRYLTDRKYFITSLLVLLECMAPFFLVLEGRRLRAREVVIIAVLCAMGILGRGALFMLPAFKPMLALTIIAGVAFGGETGFAVGAITMLVSNILFSQGPWTPWQMFAMGLCGFLAGLLFRRRWSRVTLCVFGALSAIVLYGGIMNFSSALTWNDVITAETVLAYCITGFPMDAVHAAATAAFLWFGAMPMLEKLERVKVKYGLTQ